MKKILNYLAVLLLLCAFPASAGDPVRVAMNPALFVGGGVSAAASNECASTLICQNFEGTGYDNSESWTEAAACDDTQAVCNEDYVTSPAPLRGTQSLILTYISANGTTKITFADQTEVSGHFKVRVLNDSAFTFFEIMHSTTSHFLFGYNSTDNKYVSTATLGATAFTVPETHYVWFHFKEGTGADAIKRSWYSAASRVWPGDGNEDINVTNSTSTGHVDTLRLSALAADSIIIDQIIVKAGTAGLENIAE